MGKKFIRFFLVVCPVSLFLSFLCYCMLSALKITGSEVLSVAVFWAFSMSWLFSPENNIFLGLKDLYWFDWLVAIVFSVVMAEPFMQNLYQGAAMFLCLLFLAVTFALRVRCRSRK